MFKDLIVKYYIIEFNYSFQIYSIFSISTKFIILKFSDESPYDYYNVFRIVFVQCTR